MSKGRRGLVMMAVLFGGALAQGQQPDPTSRKIHLDIVVAPKSGVPVSGLEAQDFTLLDNKAARPIGSFRAVSKGEEPVKVILLVDAVNARFSTIAYERDELKSFLLANGGHLAYPTTIAVLTDQGTQMRPSFTTDGKSLQDGLEHHDIGLRQLTRANGIYGADDRLGISLTALKQLTAFSRTTPGRKIVLWISPGWPLLSGPRIDLDAKQQDAIFGDIVSLSTQLREAGLTLYNVNPLGPNENLLREDYYQSFLKGVGKPSQTDLGDLGLQVLAIQSGGRALEGSSDVAGMLKKCLADLDAWYEISFDAAMAEKPNEYHHVEVQVNKPGLTVRTRDGYYAQP